MDDITAAIEAARPAGWDQPERPEPGRGERVEKIHATRARLAERDARSVLARPAPRHVTCPIVGVTFTAGYPDVIHRLAALASQHMLTAGQMEPIPAVLVRNPGNPYDSNAIEVHVPALGDQAMIGHLPGGVARRFAPALDAGAARYRASITEARIHPDHPDRPGIDVELERVD